MESFYINKKNYYLADDLMTNHPNYFKGCKTVRNIISKKENPR